MYSQNCRHADIIVKFIYITIKKNVVVLFLNRFNCRSIKNKIYFQVNFQNQFLIKNLIFEKKIQLRFLLLVFGNKDSLSLPYYIKIICQKSN